MRKKIILIFVMVCFCGCSSQTYFPIMSSASRSGYTTSIELESTIDESYSLIPEEIPVDLNNDTTITSSVSHSGYTTSVELESITDESYSLIPEEIPETLNNAKAIALRKEKCTQTLVDSFQRGIVNEPKGSSEQKIIYDLMDRDVICYFAFRYASSAIEEETPYHDDIFEIKKHALFKNYSELKNFVYDTYTEENAKKLLKECDTDRALYLSKDQLFLYNAENLGVVNFDIFSEGYEVEITDVSSGEIDFICYYSVWQDEEMKPVEKAIFCHAKKTERNLWKLDQNVWLN